MTLKEYVGNWISEKTKDYDGDRKAVFEDLLQHGCQSGMVGDLIYYTDTLAFYNRYREEIDALLYETIDGTGFQPNGLFAQSGWDPKDPLARETNNINLLAWFGFEETAHQIAMDEGIEI